MQPHLADQHARLMIKVEQLTKRYNGSTVADRITFTAHPGRVTGFIGPNGAGKSTVMRMICGLTQPTSGVATVLGMPFTTLAHPGRRVGVLLDASAQHAGRTGRETLTLTALLTGVDRRRVDEVLELVGLTPKESGRRVRTYSLGMRQRLGIGNALLADPQVLILDEPVNGLDPTGIQWMRVLMRDFADDGGTVLLSSHLLMEMEAIADDLVVIDGGSVVVQGAKTELLAVGGSVVRSTDDRVLSAALARAGLEVSPHHGGGLRTSGTPDHVGAVALAAGVGVTELGVTRANTLEDLFFEVTSQRGHEVDAA
jgi:ABC-2 type transport system ATP-binding protein